MNDNQFLFNYNENNNYEIFNQNEIIEEPEKKNIIEETNHSVNKNMPEIKQENISINQKQKQEKPVDLVVVGAGWSGLLACKYAKENGLNVLVLEARETIGGVWKFTEDPNTTTTIKNAHTTSSKTFTEMSDFPMPKDYPSFPSHKEVFSYLVKYANMQCA